MPETLTLAVCLCDEVTLSDFIPPMEVLGSLNFADHPAFAAMIGDVPYRFKIDYLAPAAKPVSPLTPGLPHITPTHTYAEAIEKGLQYDVIWVPAGPLPHPQLGDVTPKAEIDFIKRQAPGAKYVMSVCGGSLPLASARVLDGKRATTNKMFYRHVVAAAANDKINWVSQARWVIDGNIWTSSGVSAGTDMALAFLEHLVGRKTAVLVRGMIEVPEGGSEDDPFAVIHGLV
ncbi:class I glutamine amidotransferase-like protein [Hysterangium stoloniferum]|nr:class I glutamine amidotransferase-like protein [Hysterangium stoloniferum]